jgi:hypothetical protein
MSLRRVLGLSGYSGFAVHGLRSTFRDWAGETTGFAREVIEMALAHGLANKTEAAYQRGDLFSKRRLLMEAWDNYCSTDSTGSAPMFHEVGTARDAVEAPVRASVKAQAAD